MSTFILVVTTAGVGADLATLPLLLVAVLGRLGAFTVDPALAWLTSWPMVFVFAVVVAVEVVLDASANRKHRTLRQMWPAVQHVASAVVAIVVVLAMGASMTPTQRMAAIVMGWCCTGVIRGGLVEKAKLVLDVAGGA